METREFTKRVKEYMKMHHMAETGDGILAAVSGGADSVCLLLVLKEFAEEFGIHLAAFHLNHGLRGGEADRDEAYVRELCELQKIPLKVVHENVKQYAADRKMSEEEAGRVLRYQYLAQAAEEFGCKRIATAHHRDDNAETVLMNLFRGSGLKGLGGIRPVRSEIIRPLLQMTRQEIETYLYKKKVVWCEDSTNRENVYGRNKVRNILLPWVQEHINEQAAAHVLKTAEFAAQADEYFRAQAETLLERCADAPDKMETAVNSVSIPVSEFDCQPQIMKTYLVRAMIARVSESEKDISSRHIDAVCALTGPGGGTNVDLPYGLKAVRGYDRLEMKGGLDAKEQERNGTANKIENSALPLWSLAPNQPLIVQKSGKSIEIRIFPVKKGMEIPKKQCTKWFDYDKIKNELYIRTREPGDYYVIGDGKRKLLKRFFIDEKIPEAERSETLLLAEGNHILWIFGYRISEEYKITDHTRTILEVRMNKGEENG